MRSDPPDSPAVQGVAVEIEPLSGFGILEGIAGAQLLGRGKTGHETGFLAVDQGVDSAVPGSPLHLNEPEQEHQQSNVSEIVNDGSPRGRC